MSPPSASGLAALLTIGVLSLTAACRQTLPNTNGDDATVTPADGAVSDGGDARADAALSDAQVDAALDAGADAGQDPPGMLFVAAGAFWMGCTGQFEPHCWDDEVPYHEVTLSAFWIDLTEVTQAAYHACVQTGPCTTNAGPLSASSDLPVAYVTWYQATDYCAWQSKRLPTEAECEKAARGTGGHPYPWGTAPPDCTLTNYGPCGGAAVAVGSHPAGVSPYGALDMSGNVWEWVVDWYQEDYYATSPATDPPGPASGTWRIYKGGAFTANEIARLTATRRYADEPNTNNHNRGFRCAKTP